MDPLSPDMGSNRSSLLLVVRLEGGPTTSQVRTYSLKVMLPGVSVICGNTLISVECYIKQSSFTERRTKKQDEMTENVRITKTDFKRQKNYETAPV